MIKWHLKVRSSSDQPECWQPGGKAPPNGHPPWAVSELVAFDPVNLELQVCARYQAGVVAKPGSFLAGEVWHACDLPPINLGSGAGGSEVGRSVLKDAGWLPGEGVGVLQADGSHDSARWEGHAWLELKACLVWRQQGVWPEEVGLGVSGDAAGVGWGA